jgi:GNAT superfamily N-acetyltransferase
MMSTSSRVLRILGPGDELALKRFLSKRLESSLFLYGNMLAAGLEDSGARYSGTYAAAFESADIVAVAGLFWNGSLVLQAPEELPALTRLAWQSCGRPLRRLIGPSQQVAAAMEELALSGDDIQVDEPEKLYRLALDELITPPLLTSGRGRGRLIGPQDEELLTGWRIDFLRETHLAQDGDELAETVRQGVRAGVASGNIWVLEVEDKLVSCTSFNAAVRDEGITSTVQVGGVYTPPEHRSQGFARAVVAASLIDAREIGYHRSVLFTGMENTPAQKAYEALGYRQIGTYRISVLREALSG